MRKLPSGMRLDLSRARRESSEGIEAGTLPEDCLWLERDAAGIALATLHLLSQWLLQAPQACRQAEAPPPEANPHAGIHAAVHPCA